MDNNQLTREEQIKGGLVAQNKMVQSLFGDKKKAAKFLATAAKVANDHKLANCNVNSIIDACITVAQINLDLSPALSHAYIVPFKGNVQLIISTRGYTALLARTGWKLKSYIVNESDDFEYIVDGFNETIKFTKNIDAEEEVFKYAVALAQSPDGTIYVEVMNAKQIDKHRKVSSNQTKISNYTSKENRELISQGKPVGVWKDWFQEMAQKTVIKKLVKKLPMCEDVGYAIDKDDKPIETEITEPKQEIDLNSLVSQGEIVDQDTGEIKEVDPSTISDISPKGNSTQLELESLN